MYCQYCNIYSSESVIIFKVLKVWVILECFALSAAFTHTSNIMKASAAEVSDTLNPIQASNLTKFQPRPQSSTTLDYQYLDYILENSVFYLGLSDRIRRVNRNTFNDGKRGLTVGHKSPYRLEGSRIYLKNLPPKFNEDMKAYREELQNLAISLPLTHLSRDEQLAFWLNIHNASVIELLSQQKRARSSKDKRFGAQKEALHDVKIVQIGDTALSLRDIREKIVYQNWSDPAVMYGFFLGDIGSPALKYSAFKGATVMARLEENAEEFVNALRGFEIHNGRPQVSELYHRNAQMFFPQFNRDLKLHFKKYMRPEVYVLAQSVDSFTIAPYDYRVASITAGRNNDRTRIQVTQSYNPDLDQVFISTDDIASGRNSLAVLIKDYVKKRERLKDMGLLENEVTIEDIETEDLP